MTMTIDIPGAENARSVDDQDLVGYLTSKGIEVHRSAGAEVQIHCLFCPDGDPKGKGRLYLNTESWLWSCFRCEARGNRRTLLQHFGDEDGLTYPEGTDPGTRRRILLEATNLAHDMLLGNERVCQYLLDRGISSDHILSARLGYVPQNVGIAEMLRHQGDWSYKDLISVGLLTVGGREFFNDSITIPYWSHGSVVQLRAKDFGAKYRTLANDISRIYNSDALLSADEVLITEGEFDSLAVRSALAGCGDRRMENLAVVGIAGAGSWPEGLVPALSNVSKVFIGFDPDETGTRFATKLKEAIGNRARVVELPAGLPKTDWSDLLSAKTPNNPNGGRHWTDVRDLLLEADLAGKRIFSVRDAAQKWKRMRDERPGLKLGFVSMDAILRPGLKPGQVMIPLAGTGCIQGDADVVVNRGGKSFRMTLRDLVHMFNGGGHGRGGVKTWDLSIPTMVQREVDGQVRLGKLKNAWYSGSKYTYTVETAAGRTIRATDEHPFLTARGWLRLDQLRIGDQLHVNAGRSKGGRKRNVRSNIGLDEVVRIASYGYEDTYDLEVEDDPHNFIVNEIVVHNTGKTVFLSNIAHNVRSQGVLYLSLELTASEVYEQLRRIHRFWNPTATPEQMLVDYELVQIVEQNRIHPGDLNGYIHEYEEIVGRRPGLVIVDYLQYFARSFRGNSAYDRSTDAVMELKAVAKEELVPIVAPSQVNRTAEAGKPLTLSHARDAGTVEETGDFVVSLYRPELVTEKVDPNTPATAPTGNFNAQLLKSRHGGVGRVFNLRFSPMSLVIVDALDRANAMRVSQEVSLANQGVHYDDYRKQVEARASQDAIPGLP